MPVNQTIQIRRDTAANWASANPVLAAGELGWDTTNEILKIGDGATAWASLSATAGGGGSTVERQITFVIDGGGSAITTGAQKVYVTAAFSGTITKVRLVADQVGSIVLDIWKDTYANFPPTDADSITASAQPTLSSANKSEDSTLTGWTTSITEGDILEVNVDSASTVTKVIMTLFVDQVV